MNNRQQQARELADQIGVHEMDCEAAMGEPVCSCGVWAESVSHILAYGDRCRAEGEHLCSGCHHRWDGPLKGAELCGDCWRQA